jgi:putative CRISPR-associated protein (TIGR02619 family)
MKPNITVSTIGTSILTNKQQDNKVKEILTKTANLTESEISKDDKKIIDQIVEERKNLLLNSDIEKVRDISAELNGLLGIYNNNLNQMKNDIHWFVATYTYQASKIKDILDIWFRNKNINQILLIDIELLQANENVQWSFPKLVKRIKEINDTRSNYNKVIFNLVGGFKILQGFMQTIGMLYADEIYYLFEGTRNVIKIPKFPIKPDFSEEIINKLRLIKYEVNTDTEGLGILIIKENNNVLLSDWGEIIFEREKNSFYQELHPPILNNINYSETFKKQFNNLNPKQKVELHEKIDQLSKYLYTKNEKYNPSSLRFHSINHSRYTHEFYPFTGDGRRVYGNMKNNIFIIEKIDSHL